MGWKDTILEDYHQGAIWTKVGFILKPRSHIGHLGFWSRSRYTILEENHASWPSSSLEENQNFSRQQAIGKAKTVH